MTDLLLDALLAVFAVRQLGHRLLIRFGVLDVLQGLDVLFFERMGGLWQQGQ